MIRKNIIKLSDTKNFKITTEDSSYASFNWKKITHLPFDITELKKELDNLEQNFSLINYPISKKKSRYYYKGLSLTSFKNEVDKLAGSFYIFDQEGNVIDNEEYVGIQQNSKMLNLKEEYAEDFEYTDACVGYFKKVLSAFNAPITRVRLLELKPGGVIPAHIDYPYEYGIKLHAYIRTNNEVVCEVNGEQFKIPDDGFFYWMDTSKPHSVINLGNTSRISLCVNLNPYSCHKYQNKTIEEILDEL